MLINLCPVEFNTFGLAAGRQRRWCSRPLHLSQLPEKVQLLFKNCLEGSSETGTRDVLLGEKKP